MLKNNVKSAMGIGCGDRLLLTKMLRLSTAKYKAVWKVLSSSWHSSI